ncbi:unnamed protein product [Rhizophagus irregularis]|nr:unnamed protein product [Rhizophagus irregularis]
MELTKKLNYDSFDPTPKLKSSPVPISFVSFNEGDLNCIHCEDRYVKTACKQYYCKKCLSYYLANITDNNLYLDVHILTNLKCSKHEISMTKKSQNIQECCRNCLGIFFFKQIPSFVSIEQISVLPASQGHNRNKNENYCKLCGKSMYQGITKFTWCSDCYLISSECVVSTLTKKPITIFYLPCWLNINSCYSCYTLLKFTSDCQKYCENCFTFYIGCRYCLTTNIIFGITNQSQCKKCKRVSSIIFDVTRISSGNSDLDDFLDNSRLEIYNQLKLARFTDKKKNIIPYILFHSTYKKCPNSFISKVEISMELIPYSQFTNVKELARGGFGIIFLANWLDGPIKGNNNRKRNSNETVILKKFKNSQDISKYFLNELKSNQQCYKIAHSLIRIYGITRDPKFDDHILVMQYASGGDLHNWIQENFTKTTWNNKIGYSWKISYGLETIHAANYMHRDFHSGNIFFNEGMRWLIGDLGLSQPADNTSNNEIYGVIPYIAPEIFKGSAFSKKSDVYCMGMIMWELTTGCKPFSNVEHDINLVYKILDGERPEITKDTPKRFASLMKSCWDPDPEKRPSITEVRKTLSIWYIAFNNIKSFNRAETKRKELMSLKKLGPEFSGKPHPGAIYTSRSLNSFISKCSSISNSSKEYISTELEFDIDFSNKSNTLGTKRKIEEIYINSHGNNGKSIKISSSYSRTSLTDE